MHCTFHVFSKDLVHNCSKDTNIGFYFLCVVYQFVMFYHRFYISPDCLVCHY